MTKKTVSQGYLFDIKPYTVDALGKQPDGKAPFDSYVPVFETLAVETPFELKNDTPQKEPQKQEPQQEPEQASQQDDLELYTQQKITWLLTTKDSQRKFEDGPDLHKIIPQAHAIVNGQEHSMFSALMIDRRTGLAQMILKYPNFQEALAQNKAQEIFNLSGCRQQLFKDLIEYNKDIRENGIRSFIENLKKYMPMKPIIHTILFDNPTAPINATTDIVLSPYHESSASVKQTALGFLISHRFFKEASEYMAELPKNISIDDFQSLLKDPLTQKTLNEMTHTPDKSLEIYAFNEELMRLLPSNVYDEVFLNKKPITRWKDDFDDNIENPLQNIRLLKSEEVKRNMSIQEQKERQNRLLKTQDLSSRDPR